MAHRNLILFAVAVCLAVLVVTPLYSKKTGKGKITHIKEDMEKVVINYDKHMKAGVTCNDCHHEENVEGNRCTGCHHRKEAKNQACSSCHTKKKQLKRPEKEIIYHRGLTKDGHGGNSHLRYSCSGCHQIRKQQGKKTGPLYRDDGEGCDGCHVE